MTPGSQAHPTSAPPARRRTWRAKLAWLALGAAASFAGAELALRWALFSEAANGLAFARRLRRAEKYGDPQRDDRYWELKDRFLRAERSVRVAPHDDWLGWTSGLFSAGTYVHQDAELAQSRRPVLLFGDSYAQCITAPEERFESLFTLSPLGADHCLINFGVGGYGIDQMLLLMQRSLDAYRGLDPIVVVGVLVDDDLDRAVLSLREKPKPRFELARGALAPPTAPTPTYEEFVRRGLTPTPSYLWLYLTQGSRLLPRGVRDLLTGAPGVEREKERLSRAILAEMLRELDARGHARMFVLFHNLPSLVDRERCGWRDAALREPLAAAGAPVVDVREFMLATAARTGEALSSWFDNVPKPGGHYNARGNEVAFEAIAQGLATHFGMEASPAPLTVRDWSRRELRGAQASIEFEFRRTEMFPDARDRARLSLRVGDEGPSEVEYPLDGRAASFRARARLVPLSNNPRGSVELTFESDGEVLEAFTLRRVDAERPLVLDLRGRRTLTIRVSDAGDGVSGDWAVLAEPRFE